MLSCYTIHQSYHVITVGLTGAGEDVVGLGEAVPTPGNPARTFYQVHWQAERTYDLEMSV